MQQYRRFLQEAPETAMTPEAIRRLADLQLEKQFGIRGGNAKPREMAARSPPRYSRARGLALPIQAAVAASAGLQESDQDFERRTTAEAGILAGSNASGLPADAARAGADPEGPLEAIALYNRLLTSTPVTRTVTSPLSDGAGVRRARAHRRGHRDNGAPKPHESAFCAPRRSAVQAGRVFLTQQTLPRRRERLFGYRQTGEPPPSSFTSSLSTSSDGTFLQAGIYEEACKSILPCSTTRYRSVTTSIKNMMRTTIAVSRIRSE